MLVSRVVVIWEEAEILNHAEQNACCASIYTVPIEWKEVYRCAGQIQSSHLSFFNLTGSWSSITQ